MSTLQQRFHNQLTTPSTMPASYSTNGYFWTSTTWSGDSEGSYWLDPRDDRYLPIEALKTDNKVKCEYCGTTNLLPEKADKIPVALCCGACNASLP